MCCKTILKLLYIIAIICTTKILVHYLHVLQDEIILHISITEKFILCCRIYFPTAWNHSSWECSQKPVHHKNLVKLGLSFWSKHGSKMCIRSSTHSFSRRTVSFLEIMSRCLLHLMCGRNVGASSHICESRASWMWRFKQHLINLQELVLDLISRMPR